MKTIIIKAKKANPALLFGYALGAVAIYGLGLFTINCILYGIQGIACLK